MCICIVMYLGINSDILLIKPRLDYNEYPLFINEVMVNNRSSIRDEEGDFEDWIEIYNSGDSVINLQGFGLSNDRKQPFLWTFPDKLIEPKSYLIVWTSEKNKNQSDGSLHTNFKLKNNNKVIVLTSPNNNWSNLFLLVPMGDNISYGRRIDGSIEFCGFDGGTPGSANHESESLIGEPDTSRLKDPVFSHNGGLYTQAFDLSITTGQFDAEIYYTVDGTIPTKKSNYFTKPITIQSKPNGATIIRARVFKSGYPKSDIVTQSFFVDKNIYNTYNTPVISLVTDPINLFDYEKGIYVAGKIFDQWKIDNPYTATNQMTPANYNQRGKEWEREASIELLEPDGKVGLVQNIGIRIHGGYSRANNLKTLALFANKHYDEKDYFQYDFFDGKSKDKVNDNEVNQFSKILLRTSATEGKYSLFRDALIQGLVGKSMILDTQYSKPSIVYINGEYYGIHNIREAYDKSYISNYYKMDEDDVVIIKNPTGYAGIEVLEGNIGDEMHYDRIIAFIKEHNLKENINYDFIKTLMDIDNFIEYNILQIYCDNRDWPGNNVSVWRKRTQAYEPNTSYGHDGRWRWLVYDLDYGLGLFTGEKAAQNNSLERAIQVNGPEWPNPPWSTLLLRSLLENNEFKNQFINTFADRLNTIFLPEVVVDRIEDMEEIYYPNIMNHISRWNLHENKVENWVTEVEKMKFFANERPKYVYQHMIDIFHLEDSYLKANFEFIGDD